MDFNQISSDNKDLQVLLVDGPKMRFINPRWRTAAILKNRINTISLQPFDQFFIKFGTVMYLGSPQHSQLAVKIF